MRTEGLVEKIKEKYEDFKTQTYNIDAIAQKSTITSEQYSNYVNEEY